MKSLFYITLQNSQYNPFLQLKLGTTLSLRLFGEYFDIKQFEIKKIPKDIFRFSRF